MFIDAVAAAAIINDKMYYMCENNHSAYLYMAL